MLPVRGPVSAIVPECVCRATVFRSRAPGPGPGTQARAPGHWARAPGPQARGPWAQASGPGLQAPSPRPGQGFWPTFRLYSWSITTILAKHDPQNGLPGRLQLSKPRTRAPGLGPRAACPHDQFTTILTTNDLKCGFPGRFPPSRPQTPGPGPWPTFRLSS